MYTTGTYTNTKLHDESRYGEGTKTVGDSDELYARTLDRPTQEDVAGQGRALAPQDVPMGDPAEAGPPRRKCHVKGGILDWFCGFCRNNITPEHASKDCPTIPPGMTDGADHLVRMVTNPIPWPWGRDPPI